MIGGLLLYSQHKRYTSHSMQPEQMLSWDQQIAANPDGGNTFQSAEFAEAKKLNHWEPVYRSFNGVVVTILQKPVKYLGHYWYIPKGPGITNVHDFNAFVQQIGAEAKLHNVFAVKFEPELLKTVENHQVLSGLGLVPSRIIQPNSSTVLVNLAPSLDEISASLNQKARHAINRASRDGVTVKAVDFTANNTRLMYDLLVETAAGRFEQSIRPYDYYYRFWSNFYYTDRGSLFFAYFDGQVVSAAFAMYLGQKSTYKDGASLRDKQVYGASHLLQWEIMKWMKERGVTQHDLCGSPPSNRINDTTHPHHGIGRFKTSFNKEITDYIGAYDLIIKPSQYKIWNKIGERLTLRNYYKKHRQSWY